MSNKSKHKSGLLKILFPLIVGTGTAYAQEAEQDSLSVLPDTGKFVQQDGVSRISQQFNRMYRMEQDSLEADSVSVPLPIATGAARGQDTTKVKEPKENIVAKISKAFYSKPDVSLTLGPAVRKDVLNSWNSYLQNDAMVYRELNESLDSLEKNRGDLKTLEDEKYSSIISNLNSIKNSLDRVVVGDSVTFRSSAAQDKVDETLKYLQSLEDYYQNQLDKTEDGFDRFKVETENSGLLPKRVRKKIKAKDAEIQTRITELGNLLTSVKDLVEYVEKVPETKGFSDPVEFTYGPDDLDGVIRFLKTTYMEVQREFKNEPELFESWVDEFYNPRVLSVRNTFKNTLKEYMDPKDIEKVMDKYDFGNELTDVISEERENLKTATKSLEDLAKGKVLKTRKVRRGTRKAKKARVRRDVYRSPLEISPRFGLGAIYSLDDPTQEPLIISGIFGLGVNKNAFRFEYGRGTKQGSFSSEDIGETDNITGFHGHGYISSDRDVDLERIALIYSRNLVPMFEINGGVVRYNKRIVNNSSVRNELHNADHEILGIGDSYARSDVGSSNKYGFNIGFGLNYKNLSLNGSADFFEEQFREKGTGRKLAPLSINITYRFGGRNKNRG